MIGGKFAVCGKISIEVFPQNTIVPFSLVITLKVKALVCLKFYYSQGFEAAYDLSECK